MRTAVLMSRKTQCCNAVTSDKCEFVEQYTIN